MSSVFKKKTSFEILYEKIGDVRTNQRIDNPDFSLGGLDFQFNIRKNEEDAHNKPYAIFVDLAERSKKNLLPGYEIKVAKFKAKFVNEAGISGESVIESETSFDQAGSVKVFPFRLTKHCDVDITMKFVDVVLRPLKFVDAEEAKQNLSDVKIVLVDDEDKEVFAHKNLLAMNSSFFRKLFYGDIKEKEDTDVVRLSDVKQTDFLDYISCIYPPPNRPLNFKRLETLHILANRFQNDALISTIKEFVKGKKKKNAKENRLTLTLADNLNMPDVFRATLKAMNKTELKALSPAMCKEFKKEHVELLVACILGRL